VVDHPFGQILDQRCLVKNLRDFQPCPWLYIVQSAESEALLNFIKGP
jgi:hypothetical protein